MARISRIVVGSVLGLAAAGVAWAAVPQPQTDLGEAKKSLAETIGHLVTAGPTKTDPGDAHRQRAIALLRMATEELNDIATARPLSE